MRFVLIIVGLLIALAGGYFLIFGWGEKMTEPVAVQSPVPAPDQQADINIPTFDIARIERNGSAVVAGRALPGATVTLNANGEPLAEATADDRGEWVMVLDEPIQPGDWDLTLSAENPDGSRHDSEQTVAVSVPESEDNVALVVMSEPGKASRVLQGPGVPADAGNLVLEAVDYDQDGNVIVSGKGDPNRVVRVYIADQAVGDARADAKGRWELRPETIIAPGVYALRIDQLNEDGQVISRVELPFERGDPETVRRQLAAGQVIIQPGNNLWSIARHLYGSGFRYTVIYEANKAQIRDPDLIYPGQVFSTPPSSGG